MFAGLDVGSTNAKFSIYDCGGRLLSEASRRYPVAGSTELSADMVWAAVRHVMRTACVRLPVGQRVEAMAVSAYGESLIPVDGDGNVLSNRFVCSSEEGDEQLCQILEWMPAADLQDITGVFPHRRFPLVKMLWFKQHTRICDLAARFLTMEDFLLYRLTGYCVISDSSAARTMAYNRKKRCWSSLLLGRVGIDQGRLSDILPSGSDVGSVLPELCEELGFAVPVRVFTGGHDQMCNAVGAGLHDSGTAVNCSGTVECIAVIAEQKRAEELKAVLPLQFAPFPETLDCSFTFWAPVAGCSSLDWCLRLLAGELGDRALADRHTAIQALCTDNPSPLLTAPYFTGRNYPDLTSELRGSVWGLDIKTTPQDIYQSIMEGIAFELLICLEYFRLFPAGNQRMAVVGGGARSEYWMQMKADIMGLPMVSMEHGQSGTMGAMLLAATGSGYYRNLVEAAEACVRMKRVFYPESQAQCRYAERFERYREYRNSLLELGHHIK